MKGMSFLPILLLCGCAALQAQQQTADSPPDYSGEPAVAEYADAPAGTASDGLSPAEGMSPGTIRQNTAVSAAAPARTAPPASAQPAQASPAPAAEPSSTPVALPRTIPPEVQSVPDKDADRLTRTERRRLKAERFAARLDSLVRSHNFRFLPNSMQELPGGWTQLIYNELYFVGIFSDHVEVHMPMIRGNTVEYIEILNFDTFELQNYQISQVQYGWNVSFNMTHADRNYTVNMMVYTLTGQTVLNLLTLSNTIRYVGYIQPLSKD